MPNLLVTGRWGETHVTSAQARNFHAGVFGGGQYVLSGLTATMTTANTCHIDPGVACFNGADVEVPAGGVDVTIDNGTQGQKRNDLVVLRYTSEPSTQTESVELAVVKGTPASSDPQDPAHNEGSILEGDSPCDMPLYRIPLDGITVGDPVLLAPAWMAPNRAVVSSADGTPTASAVTATELGYLSGAESSIQGQLDDVRDSLSQRLPMRTGVADLSAVSGTCVFVTDAGPKNAPQDYQTARWCGIQLEMTDQWRSQLICQLGQDTWCSRGKSNGSWFSWKVL